MASEAEHIREPLEYPELDGSIHEDVLVSEGMITDYITEREIKDSPKERVRQRIIRALFHEYGFPTKEARKNNLHTTACDLGRCYSSIRHETHRE